ncbi:hypothetical protein MCOR12_009877 [Pyricularia oryzae]|nr:hypothetical protein MCOR06_011164 [Pyricularia oryzae]KAI6586455.1 hypothetical protein MCOR12_009877 [Pyricularia oryzae]
MHFSIPFQLALVTGLSPLALAAVLVDHGENSPGLVARDSPRGNAAPSGLGADAPACAGRNTDKKHRLVARGNGGCWGGGSPRPVQGRFGERRPSEDDWPDPIDTDYSRGSMSVNDSPQAMSVSHSQESMSIHYPHSSSSVESSPKKSDSHSSKDPKNRLVTRGNGGCWGCIPPKRESPTERGPLAYTRYDNPSPPFHLEWDDTPLESRYNRPSSPSDLQWDFTPPESPKKSNSHFSKDPKNGFVAGGNGGYSGNKQPKEDQVYSPRSHEINDRGWPSSAYFQWDFTPPASPKKSDSHSSKDPENRHVTRGISGLGKSCFRTNHRYVAT